MFSSYSWFGNDLQVPESNSTALPDALIKIYAAKLSFVAAGLVQPPQLGGAGGWGPSQPRGPLGSIYAYVYQKTKKQNKKNPTSLNPEPFKMIKDLMQVIVCL